MFVFVPELFKCNSKLLWRLGSLNGLREAVPKQCSMEEKTVLVACGAYFGKGLSGMACVCCGWSGKKEGEKVLRSSSSPCENGACRPRLAPQCLHSLVRQMLSVAFEAVEVFGLSAAHILGTSTSQ